ncbi:P-loop containing nucleoside triphosphate hydrolase protein [Biscogniauxia marginata]|nr:P-loop containing nucleoside triphosphate hydrolase protein [Biscogniauxia marginata]
MADSFFNTPTKEAVRMEMNKSLEFRVPIAQSFSFTVSDFWKPTSGPLLQWINDLPDPVKREEPLEPAHFQTSKHPLDIDSSEAGCSIDDHRDKRPRLTSALSHHPGIESRRQILAESGRGLARRVSNACRRVVSPTSHQAVQDVSDTSTFRASTSLPNTPTTVSDRPKMRFVLVGDSECGKSSLLLRYYRDTFTLDYAKTQYELFNKYTVVDGQEVELEMWDTCGDIKLHQLCLLSYLAWDAVILCFDVNNSRRFNNAKTKWVNEIRKFCRDAPVILVGLKKDQRGRSELWAPMFPHMETRIPAAEGTFAANTMGAIKYIECSAKTGEGVDHVFEEAVRVVFDERAADEETERLRKEKAKKQGGRNTLSQMLCFK